MDKWKFKEYLKIITYCAIAIIIFLVVMELIVEPDKTKIIENLKFPFSMIIIVDVFLSIPVVIYQIYSWILKSKNKVKFENYSREIQKEYTPAIASFLIDNDIEENKDILATILDLESRNYLKIIRDDKMEIYANNQNTDDLYLHEKYIIWCISNGKMIKPYEFVNQLEKDCVNSKLLIDSGKRSTFHIYLLAFEFMVVIAMTSFIDTYKYTHWAWIGWILSITCLLLTFAKIKRTNYYGFTFKGKHVATEFRGLKQYLKDYTLLKTKDIEYIKIYDRYLTFALALEEADAIEKLYVPYNGLISKYVDDGKFGRESNYERTDYKN